MRLALDSFSPTFLLAEDFPLHRRILLTHALLREDAGRRVVCRSVLFLSNPRISFLRGCKFPRDRTKQNLLFRQRRIPQFYFDPFASARKRMSYEIVFTHLDILVEQFPYDFELLVRCFFARLLRLSVTKISTKFHFYERNVILIMSGFH